MRHRSRLALSALAIAALAALTACTSSGSSAGSVTASTPGAKSFQGQTLTALVGAAGAGLANQYNDYFATLKKAFTADTGATLKLEFYNGGTQENSIIQTALVSSNGPDVVGYGSSAGATLAATGGFLTLTKADWNEVGGRDAWSASTLSASGSDASHDIGIPSFGVPYVIAYNKAMFEKAGISGPPNTWDEWVSDAQKVQAANPGVFGAGFDPSDPSDPWKFIWSYTHQLGGSFMSTNGKKANLDSKQVNAAMNFYFSQFYKEKIVPPDSLAWNNAQMISAFTSGKIAMLPIATAGVLTAAKGTPVANDVAFAQLPGVPFGLTARPAGGTPAASIVSGQFWAIFKYAAKKKDLALALAKVSNDLSVEKVQYQELGWTPTTKVGIAALSKSAPEVAPFLAIQSKMEATEFTPAWSALQAGVTTAVNKVAQNLATSGSWSNSFLTSQLTSANQAAEATLQQ